MVTLGFTLKEGSPRGLPLDPKSSLGELKNEQQTSLIERIPLSLSLLPWSGGGLRRIMPRESFSSVLGLVAVVLRVAELRLLPFRAGGVGAWRVRPTRFMSS